MADVKTAERQVTQIIKKAEADLRAKYKIFQYQDLIASVIFFGSLGIIFGFWYLYYQHQNDIRVIIACIIGIGYFTSFLHELEHDLIHNLYFKKSFMQDVMFMCIWLSKLHGNPWFRRDLHLKHHIISGQHDDAEERLIGLGLPFGWTRLAVTVHPFGSLLITKDVAKDAKWLDVQKLNLSSAPVAFLFFGLNKAFMIYVIAMYFYPNTWSNYLPARHWWWIRDSNILVCIPNIIRQVCLVAMSNLSHYYGDIPEKSVFYQNQILDHWLLAPFQFFCCNFGATHIVHHYVPGQPFYIREIIFKSVKQPMIDLGVRCNDFGIIFRANRYYDNSGNNDTTTSHKKTDGDSSNTKNVSANGSGGISMTLWLLLCTTIGMLSYIIFDQWVSISLGRRITRKYITKAKDVE